MPDRYDVIIIGAGPGGYPCAIRLGQLGKKVLVIEAKHLGGLCLNWGCIPTKALSYAAEMTDNFKKAKRMGFQITTQGCDLKTLRTWKQGIVERLRKGIDVLFKSCNVECKHGYAQVVSQHQVQIDTDGQSFFYEAENIVLATGTEVTPLPGFEYDHKYIISTDDALELKDIPKRLLVIGAGASGLEIATIYHRLGSQVTVVEIMEQILPGMEGELCYMLTQIMKKAGIQIHTSTQVSGYKKGAVSLEVTMKTPATETQEFYDKILVSVGRKPITKVFEGLEIKTDTKGYVVVDTNLHTSINNIYAIGDLVGAPLLAHKATKQGIALAEMLGGENLHIPLHTIPSCVFTIPPLSSIGLTEKEATARGVKIKIGRFPYRASGKALSMGDTEGMVKIIGDDQGKLLGLHILGAESSSLIGEGILAIEKGMSVKDIAEALHPHPTLTEMLQETAENFYKKAIHIPNK
jgi:dihydrolipoamide dehydrogenase